MADVPVVCRHHHVKKGVRRNYNLNAYLREKQKAMVAWEAHLRTLISG